MSLTGWCEPFIQLVDFTYPTSPFTPATETACKVKGCRCRKFEDGQIISGYVHCIGDCNHTRQMHAKPKPKTETPKPARKARRS